MEHRVFDDPQVVQQKMIAVRKQGKLIGVVPTMGALHEGHLSLVQQAKRDADFVVVTIFVNPTQFAPHEDFDKYPRTLKQDLEQLRELEVDLIFTPANESMYPPGYDTFVEVVESAKRFEGVSRPAHYRGVATVVLKLLNITMADMAFFGQKDYQQCCVIKKMTADLNLPVRITVCPTVREPDGLAMSSRNRYLSPEERTQALVLSRSLTLAQELVDDGMTDTDRICRMMREKIETSPLAQIDYIAIADPVTLEELATISARPQSQTTGNSTRAVVLLAVRFGATRLIDNTLLF
ncbi:MAG: pantoate--beta-alanine ligase [Planctomycetaceae bacterium]|nr:pantoate--beta-alanine ligase [Planctomycetaceae bacterium]